MKRLAVLVFMDPEDAESLNTRQERLNARIYEAHN